jgi:hypothetical protein
MDPFESAAILALPAVGLGRVGEEEALEEADEEMTGAA